MRNFPFSVWYTYLTTAHRTGLPWHLSLRNILITVKKENPAVSKVLLRSDNAGCYHNASLIQELKNISDRTGVRVIRYDFSDPQSGKDTCDRKIAPMKSQITAYVNEKRNVTNAAEMKKAIDSHNGVKGCRVAVATIDTATEQQKQSKLEGISLLNNFQYEQGGIRVWRAFEIGEGQMLPYNDLRGDEQESTGLNLLEDFGEQIEGQIKSKSNLPAPKDIGSLFPCSEPGCIRSFKDEEALEKTPGYRATFATIGARVILRQNKEEMGRNTNWHNMRCTKPHNQ